LTASDEMLDDMENEKSESFVAPMNPLPKRQGARGPPTNDTVELTKDPLKPPLFQPAKDLRDVPTTLEGILAVEGEGKSANEVLGVLVAAHERRAMAILQRTRLKKEEVIIVANLFNVAKHGIGGRNPALNKPIPDISEWALTILEALPSVDGKSRAEFVDAWQRSQEERRLQRIEEMKRQERYMGT